MNVADGTYAEGLDFSGFVGSGMYTSTHGFSITLQGNETTPANVIFSGTVTCPDYLDGSTNVGGACMTGSAKIILHGLTITNGSSFGISCYGGVVEYKKVVVTLTGGAAASSYGIVNLGCVWNVVGDLTISGFDTLISPQAGFGIYCAHGTIGTVQTGTVTITGPGTGGDAGAHGTGGIILEYADTGLTLLTSTANLTISAVNTAILIDNNATFTQQFGSTITMSNGSTTPTGSTGIDAHSGGRVNLSLQGVVNGPTLNIDHYTTCIFAGEGAGVDQKGSRSLTNCTPTATSNGGLISLL